MKSKMGFVHKFAYSFFNFSAYKEFLSQGLGKSIFYIFLVTLIFSTVCNINTISIFNSEISVMEQNFVHNAPNFELKDGTFHIDSDEPIFYKYHGDILPKLISANIITANVMNKLISEWSNLGFDSVTDEANKESNNPSSSQELDENDSYILIADTNGKTDESVLNPYCNGIYIDSSRLILRENYTTIQLIKFTDFSTLSLTNETAQNYLSKSKLNFPIKLLILNPLTSFVINLLSVFVLLGPLTMYISSIMGAKFKYVKACTLSFYAMTLPLLLESLLKITGIQFTESSAIFYIISLVYCSLAIKEILKTDKSNLNFMK